MATYTYTETEVNLNLLMDELTAEFGAEDILTVQYDPDEQTVIITVDDSILEAAVDTVVNAHDPEGTSKAEETAALVAQARARLAQVSGWNGQYDVDQIVGVIDSLVGDDAVDAITADESVKDLMKLQGQIIKDMAEGLMCLRDMLFPEYLVNYEEE